MISEVLCKVARQHGDRLAIVDGAQRISYTELFARERAVKAWLQDALGEERGVIAVALDNSWQFVACFFASAGLGCSILPCNPQWRAAELRALAQRLRFSAAVVEPRSSSEWSEVQGSISSGRLLTSENIPARFDAPLVSSPPESNPVPLDETAVYLSTSGSSGAPRLVPRTHRQLIALAENVGATLNIDPGWRYLSVVPFYHSNGIHNSLLVPLVNGASIVMMPRFSPGACAELVEREQINTLFGSPFIYAALLEGARDPGLLSSLKRCFSAGGRMSSGIAERWQDRFGVQVGQLYGMTEAGVIALESSADARGQFDGTCVGQPVKGVEIAVFSADGIKLASGETGEIAVRSPSVMRDYEGASPQNRGRFRGGFFCTGDLGFLDSSGALHLTGRIDRVLNLSGVKVDPVEVERVVEMASGVAFCHVDKISNGAGGEVIRARIVARHGFQLTRREIIEQCRRHLAEYKFPRVVEFLEESPATIAGKIPLGEVNSNPT